MGFFVLSYWLKKTAENTFSLLQEDEGSHAFTHQLSRAFDCNCFRGGERAVHVWLWRKRKRYRPHFHHPDFCRYSADLSWPASSHKATYLAFPQRKQFAEHERLTVRQQHSRNYSPISVYPVSLAVQSKGLLGWRGQTLMKSFHWRPWESHSQQQRCLKSTRIRCLNCFMSSSEQVAVNSHLSCWIKLSILLV